MRSRVGVVLPPSKLKERRKRARTVSIVVWSCAALLLCAAIVGFFYIPAFAIRDIQVEGVGSLSVESIQTRVQESLRGRRYLVFPKKNAFVYSDAAVASDLKTAFPKLDTIVVSLENFHSIKVVVTERKPYATFCGASPDVPQSPCLFLDVSGVAYEPAPDFSDNAYVRWYGGGALVSGARYLAEEKFRSVSALVDAFHSVKLEPMSAYVNEVEDVSVKDRSGLEVRFTLSRKPEEVLNLLRAALISEVLVGKALSSIEYIDLRFGNRLYYRLR